MTAPKLSAALVLALLLAACADTAGPTTTTASSATPEAAVTLGGQITEGSVDPGDASDTTGTAPDDSTTTLPPGFCRAPAAPPEGAGDRLGNLHAMIGRLAAATRDLGAAASAVTDLSSGWAAAPPTGGALFVMQAELYGLAAFVENVLREEGGTFVAGAGWTFPDPAPPLSALAEPWVLIRDYQATTVPALLTAARPAKVRAIVESGELCRVVDAFTAAFESAAASG